jgi:succinate-semialdehyde dehydrogenase/glutarate-semialdehyde dehydrogenase
MPSSFFSINPYTLEKVAEYPAITMTEANKKLELAHGAQVHWATLSFEDRAVCFRRLAQYLRTHQQDLAVLLSTEMGKILAESRAEIEKCAGHCDYFAQAAEGLLQPDVISTDASDSRVIYEPVGVVLAIMPWNFPFWQVFRYGAPALMAGNVTLLKHAPNVFGCALAIEKAFLASGFPEGVFQTLISDVDIIAPILQDDRIAMVTLTGSERAGAAVAQIAGTNIKKVVLELGGSDPFLVCADADLDLAAAAAVQSRMMNAGQVCIAAKRFLVDQSIKTEFVERVKMGIEKLVQGDPFDPNTNLGPLARLDLAQQLETQLQQALKQGAVLISGGKRQDCNFQATLLDAVTPDSIVFQQETFGPLAPIVGVKNLEEAVCLANQSRYGLSAAIWTKDLDQAAQTARQLQVGSVFVNAVVRSDSRLPIGGVKKSGYGRELSEAGIKEFCHLKTVFIK